MRFIPMAPKELDGDIIPILVSLVHSEGPVGSFAKIKPVEF